MLKPEEGKKEMGVGQKVKALTWERLMGNQEVVGRWQEVRLPLSNRHPSPNDQIQLHFADHDGV